MLSKRWFSYFDTIVIVLALFHGLLYASMLPPWGLIDEEQHVDYIQYVAKNGRGPIPNQTLLSDQIIDSLFATQHWKVFHWPTPSGRTVDQLGAVAYSYEAYHPPLFYWLFAPLTFILPSAILEQLFLLRWITVLLSLLSVWFLQRTVRLIFSDSAWQLLVPLIFVALPERTFAVSRVNNDLLLEIISALFIFHCTYSLLRPFALQRVLLAAFFIGIGMWVKLSMVGMFVPFALFLWFQRGHPGWGKSLIWSGLIVGGLGGGILLRNLLRFGEITGYSTFHQIFPLVAPALSMENLLSSLNVLFRHIWVIWWKGGEASSNWLLNTFYAFLALTVLGSLIGLIRNSSFRSTFMDAVTAPMKNILPKSSQTEISSAKNIRITQLILFYIAIIFAYAGITLISYFRGMIPLPQGRFLLPAIGPIVMITAWGWQEFRYGRQLLLGLIGALFFLDTLSLWGNLLPYFYYWADVVSNGFTPKGVPDLLTHTYQQWLADKPAFIAASAPWIVLAYMASLGLTIRMIFTRVKTNS